MLRDLLLRVALLRHAYDGRVAFGFDVLALDRLFLVILWVHDLRAPALAKCLYVFARDFFHHGRDFVLCRRAAIVLHEFRYCVHMLNPSFLRFSTNFLRSCFAYQ